jgi:hypothetical protein
MSGILTSDSLFAKASSRLVQFLNSAESYYDVYNFFSGLLEKLIVDVKHLENYYTYIRLTLDTRRTLLLLLLVFEALNY